MAGSLKVKLFVGVAGVGLLLVAAAGYLAHNLLGEVEISFAQDPNAVEAHEGGRKLRLLEEAVNAKRRGYIRLTEVEINSLLDKFYFSTNKNFRTTGPVQLVKAGVLLDSSHITLVTWQKTEVYGMPLSFVWQRVFSPIQTTNGAALKVVSMRLGKMEVPNQYWRQLAGYLGSTDKIFEQRMTWLSVFPSIIVHRNELTRVPELRLYTYLEPKDEKDNKAQEKKPVAQAANTVTTKSTL